MSAHLVVGLDLSITATGICDVDGNTFTVGGKAELGDKRLRIIASAVTEATQPQEVIGCGFMPVTLVVIEALAAGHSKGNGSAAAEVMGAAKSLLLSIGTPYVLVPPATLKKFATGRGNATKPDMAVAAYKRGDEIEFADDNQCDAWWLRAAGLDALGHPLFPMPQAQRDALNVVTWPEPVVLDGAQ